MKYHWLLFDADGTLFDYDKAENTALANTFTEFSLPYTENALATYRAINSQMWRDFEDGLITQEKLKTERFGRLLQDMGTEDAPASDVFSQRYLLNLGNCVDLIEHAERVIETLSGQVHLALITNGLKEVQRSRLAKSSISRYFEAVLISDELGVAKPHPGIFDAAFVAMGNPEKQQVLIIGDSLSSDIKGGRDYGIDTCWFNPLRKPRATMDRIDYEIQNLDQILEIVTAS